MKTIISPEEKEEIAELYLAGNSINEISQIKNRSYYLIRRELESKNIKITNKILNDTQDKELCELYLSGFSIRKIAVKLNISTKVVSNTIHRNKINPRYSKYKLDDHFFDKIDSWEKAYILGLIYADGYLSKGSSTFNLGFVEKDKYILDKINECIRSDRNLSFNEGEGNNQNFYRLSITNKNFHKALVSHGATPKKAFTISFPKIDKNLIPAFILGYFDGDGYFTIDKRKRSTGYLGICSNKKFCQEVQKVLLQYDIKSNIYIHSTRNQESAELRIGKTEELYKLFDLLYTNAKMFFIRKYDKFLHLLKLKKGKFSR